MSDLSTVPGAVVLRDEVAISGPRYVPVATARERLETVDKWDALVTALDLPTLIKICTLRQGLDAADPAVRGALTAIGANPDVILAP